MVYVPQSQQASARARMLAGELTRTIEEFKRRYPDTKPSDVQQALYLTQQSEGSGQTIRLALVAAGLIAVLGLGALLFFLRASG
jgi:hypothetical protein